MPGCAVSHTWIHPWPSSRCLVSRKLGTSRIILRVSGAARRGSFHKEKPQRPEVLVCEPLRAESESGEVTQDAKGLPCDGEGLRLNAHNLYRSQELRHVSKITAESYRAMGGRFQLSMHQGTTKTLHQTRLKVWTDMVVTQRHLHSYIHIHKHVHAGEKKNESGFLLEWKWGFRETEQAIYVFSGRGVHAL